MVGPMLKEQSAKAISDDQFEQDIIDDNVNESSKRSLLQKSKLNPEEIVSDEKEEKALDDELVISIKTSNCSCVTIPAKNK